MKSFLRFLSSYIVATTTIACICANHCAIFYVYIGDLDKSSGVMTVSDNLTLVRTAADHKALDSSSFPVFCETMIDAFLSPLYIMSPFANQSCRARKKLL